MGGLVDPNDYFGIITISKKILENGFAMIFTTAFIFWCGNVFWSKTNHHKRIFKYRTF